MHENPYVHVQLLLLGKSRNTCISASYQIPRITLRDSFKVRYAIVSKLDPKVQSNTAAGSISDSKCLVDSRREWIPKTIA